MNIEPEMSQVKWGLGTNKMNPSTQYGGIMSRKESVLPHDVHTPPE